MRATVAGFRSAVTGWLQEEKATKEETLQLLEAVYGGVIDGDSYQGDRSWSAQVEVEYMDINPPENLQPKYADDEGNELPNGDCGCLLSTLDDFRGKPDGWIEGKSAIAFGWALKIPFGATPFDNRWSRAAAQGIEDYYASRGWK